MSEKPEPLPRWAEILLTIGFIIIMILTVVGNIKMEMEMNSKGKSDVRSDVPVGF